MDRVNAIEREGLGATGLGSLRPARVRNNPVRLNKSFLQNVPDSFVDFVLDTVEANAAELKTWPAGACLEVGVSGDRGSYCENDCRTANFSLVIGGQKTFSTWCGLEDFRKQFLVNLTRAKRLLSVI